MDLILSIILVISISMYKILNSPKESIIESFVIDDYGGVQEVNIREDSLVIGKNLMLRREPRAYHKILDEMGLS